MEKQKGMRGITILLLLALLLGAACSGSGDESAEGTSPTVNEAPQSGAGTGPAADPSGSSSPEFPGTSSDAPPRLDLISYAQGASLVSISFSGAEKGPSRYQAFQRILEVSAQRPTRITLVPSLGSIWMVWCPLSSHQPSAFSWCSSVT